MVTFNNKLTAIAGYDNLKVEVMNNESGQWNSSIIPPIPTTSTYQSTKLGNLSIHHCGPVLVITEFGRDTLFSFGKTSVMSTPRLGLYYAWDQISLGPLFRLGLLSLGP